MQSLPVYMRIIETCMLGLLILYFIRYRSQTKQQYCAAAAWTRASIYWCYCLLVAYCSGALAAAMTKPLITQQQLSNPTWYFFTFGLIAYMVWAYAIYWCNNTLTFDRQRNLIPQFFFGLIWGITSGLYFLAFWHTALIIGDLFGGFPLWATGLLAYVFISAWQMFWMDMYWDIWISPEHDTPDSIKRKVFFTHIPNMTFCLIYFAIYENYWVFIGLQTLALTAASIGQRMPAPWDKNTTPAARQVPGIFGLPRAGGFLEPTQTSLKKP